MIWFKGSPVARLWLLSNILNIRTLWSNHKHLRWHVQRAQWIITIQTPTTHSRNQQGRTFWDAAHGWTPSYHCHRNWQKHRLRNICTNTQHSWIIILRGQTPFAMAYKTVSWHSRLLCRRSRLLRTPLSKGHSIVRLQMGRNGLSDWLKSNRLKAGLWFGAPHHTETITCRKTRR
jgi:hypothetical protein